MITIIAFCFFYAIGVLIGGCILVGALTLIDKYRPHWIDRIFS